MMRLLIIFLVAVLACPFIYPVNAKEYIFQDDFKGVQVRFPDGTKKLYPDPEKWAFTFLPGIKYPDSYGDGTNWLAGNQEAQTYVTPFLTKIKGKPIPSNLRFDPFTIGADGLQIKADVLSPAQMLAYQVSGFQRFGSGIMISRKSFTFGHFRLIAKLPDARGSWPAFWLLPAVFKWPPEIDIFEGMVWPPHDKQLHIGLIPPKEDGKANSRWVDIGTNLSEDFHEYGLDWTPDKITWLLDGKKLWSTPTPASMKQDMYVLINLAVGGKWALNELKIYPIDGTSPERLEQGSEVIAHDYPTKMIIKSITIEKLE